MRRHHQRPWIPTQRLIALAVLATCSWGAQALTLGRFQVLSGTGEPLRAEVEITDFTPQELQGLKARIAPLASFQAAGMEYNPGLNGVTARIEQRSTGRPYILLTGQTPLREHFIDVILEAQWGTGRLVKNYALLLNPGSNAPVGAPTGLQTNAPAPVAPASPVAQAATAPVATTTPVPPTAPRSGDLRPASVEPNARQVPVYRFEAPASTANPVITAPQAQPRTADKAARLPKGSTRPAGRASAPARTVASLQVQAGDTLSQIALSQLPSNISLDQMMVALLQANPQAFIEGNVNLVKAGTVLQIPDAEQAARVSRDEARRMVSEQTRAFIDYSRQLAQSPLRLRQKGAAREVTGQVETPAPTTPAPVAPRDSLTLAQGTVAAASEAARVAAQQELKDTDTQVAQVTRNLQDLQSLANGQPPADPNTAPGLPPLPKAEEAAAVPATAASEPANQASTTLDDKPPRAGFMDQLAHDRNTQIWAGALVLAVGLIGYWIARRRREDDTEDYLPEYADTTSENSYGAPIAPTPAGMGGQMPDLDLNLDPAAPPTPGPVGNLGTPVQTTPGMAATPDSHDTDLSKLHLAAQLISKGEHELAKALLGSVLNAASPELRSKAQAMLSQLP